MEKRFSWTSEAEASLKKVPFFVRKRAKKSVEQYVIDKVKNKDNLEVVSEKRVNFIRSYVVTIDDVKAAKDRFISNMSKNIRGYQADRCFGASGCPNSANSCESVLERSEKLLEQADILSFLKHSVKEDLKYHHEFRLSCSDCPNCCSQPQIKDFGIIGAVLPAISDEPCSQCQACVNACPDSCISIPDNCVTINKYDELTLIGEKSVEEKPVIDFSSCLMCGKCIKVCPTGTICEERRGFRVQLGGRLGRHPRLAIEIDRLLSEDEAIEVLKNVIAFYKKNSKNGERFAKIFNKSNLSNIIK
ncbi:MAG: 4Fe-4S dicluster domain-containing protein [Desulfamplus sp.]|nr:4Fe-4S dicluster domain-containing protein [Desulfamplus sp.]